MATKRTRRGRGRGARASCFGRVLSLSVSALGSVARARRKPGRTRPRAASRRRAASRQRVWSLRRVAVVASLVALGVGMGYAMSSARRWARVSDRFVVGSVEVRGNSVLTSEEVVALAGVQVGESVLGLDIGGIEASLMNSPRVESAQAYGLLPDRVLIRVEEKLPFAILSTGAESVELASDGAVLPPVARTAAVNVPVITLAGAGAGIEEAASDERVVDALELLLDAREVSDELLDDISEVRIAPESGLVTYTVADGAEIRLGFGASDTRGLRRLWAVLRDLRSRGAVAESIDMRFDDQVIVKLCRRPGGGRV